MPILTLILVDLCFWIQRPVEEKLWCHLLGVRSRFHPHQFASQSFKFVFLLLFVFLNVTWVWRSRTQRKTGSVVAQTQVGKKQQQTIAKPNGKGFYLFIYLFCHAELPNVFVWFILRADVNGRGRTTSEADEDSKRFSPGASRRTAYECLPSFPLAFLCNFILPLLIGSYLHAAISQMKRHGNKMKRGETKASQRGLQVRMLLSVAWHPTTRALAARVITVCFPQTDLLNETTSEWFKESVWKWASAFSLLL